MKHKTWCIIMAMIFLKEDCCDQTKRINRTRRTFRRTTCPDSHRSRVFSAVLAREMGISQRMIAYYEGETTHPPTHLLPVFARALGVTTDQILGIEPLNKIKRRGIIASGDVLAR